jgi:hypothetical protein
MSNEETNSYALAGSPVRLSGLAQSVHALILHRFDPRPYVNGKPNKGYRKSYPSMTELQTWCTGFSRQAISKAIEELIAKGIIIRVEIGRPGQRANYMPIYALGLVGDYVNISLHKSKVYKNKKVTDSDASGDVMSKQLLPNVSPYRDTISNVSNESNNRNKDRFSELLLLLPMEFHTLQQGKNITESLNRLDAKGIPLEVTARHLSDHNYAGASNPISVLIKLLEAFSYAQPDLIAERNRTLEHNRRLDEQNAETERTTASPEVASKWLSHMRKGLNQSKNPG